MKYWLLKTEPESYSWSDMINDGIITWDGIANYQALAFMRTMSIGDKAFFYHTGKERRIMGIVSINTIDLSAKNPMITVRYDSEMDLKVKLEDMKNNPSLSSMVALKQMRLSVSPVSFQEWKEIMSMSIK